jgi:hypothetical protein
LSNDDLPAAVVVQAGKVPGDVPGRPPEGQGPRPKHKRHFSNYLLDKRLQLRYVLLVTLLSAAISAVLGVMIYHQMRLASEDVRANMAGLFDDDDDDTKADAAQIADDMEGRDRTLMYEMAAVGMGLVVILSAYLVIMTHKVAGPLYKVGLYFDKMAAGRLGHVTPLRRGDMLTDFYDGFSEMHGAVRSRLATDAAAMQKLVDACKASGVSSKAVDQLEQHLIARKKALA